MIAEPLACLPIIDHHLFCDSCRLGASYFKFSLFSESSSPLSRTFYFIKPANLVQCTTNLGSDFNGSSSNSNFSRLSHPHHHLPTPPTTTLISVKTCSGLQQQSPKFKLQPKTAILAIWGFSVCLSFFLVSCALFSRLMLSSNVLAKISSHLCLQAYLSVCGSDIFLSLVRLRLRFFSPYPFIYLRTSTFNLVSSILYFVSSS